MRTSRTASAAALAAWILADAAGCYHGLDSTGADGGDDGGDGSGAAASSSSDGGPADDPLISECRRPSWEVFLALEPSCAGCHGEGTSVPLMHDFVAFEQLVVYDETLVVPGAPDESRLLAKDREEEILRDAMARDLADLVLRRLGSL